MKKRIFAMVMMLLLLTNLFVISSCSNNISDESKKIETTANTSDIDSSQLSAIEQRRLVSDDLPNITFADAEFRVLSETDKQFEVWSDGLNGDICNDAVYKRNDEIMERFDVEIVSNAVNMAHEKIVTLVLSDTDEYDLVSFYSYFAYTPITAKVLHDWYNVDYVNLEKPWYNKLSNDSSTINGKLFGVSSDYLLTSMLYTFGIFFNEYLIEDYGFTADGFYDMVFEGSWTFDVFTEIVKSMYDDLNTNGKADKGDLFGFYCTPINPADTWFTSFGLKYVEPDENGVLEVTYMNEKMVDAFEKVYAFHHDNEAFYMSSYAYEEETAFLNQETVFAPLRFHAAYTTLRTREFDLGILPYPKLDTEQETYMTKCDDKFTLAAIPLTVSEEDLTFVGIVFEALNAETYKEVYPVYYDFALKNKYTDDPITAEIIDLIMDGNCFEFVFQFGESETQRLPYMWRDLILSKSSNISSKYASIENALEEGIANIYEYYE